MLNFIFVILIFLEIFVLYFIIQKLIEFDNKIKKLADIVEQKGKIINEMHLKIQKIIRKINAVVSFLRKIQNSKIWKIMKVISIVISTIELILIIKSFNIKKGVKFNLKNIKKLLLARLSKVIIKKFFNTVVLAC